MPRKPSSKKIPRLQRRVAGRSIDWRPEEVVSKPSNAKRTPPWESAEELERHAIQLLIHLYDDPQGNVSKFLKWKRFEPEDGIALISHLANGGFAENTTAYGNPSASLTDEGARLARECIDALKPARRAAALRIRLLNWLNGYYMARLEGDDWWIDLRGADLYADYYGTVVTKENIVRAVVYLIEHNMITGDSGYEPSSEDLSRLRPTARGHDCIDDFGGDVAKYLNRDSRPNIHIENSTGIVAGTGTVGNIVAGDNNNVTNVASGIDKSAITDFLDRVRRDLPYIDFDNGEAQADVEDDLNELEEEVQESDPNVRIVRKLMAGLAKRLGRAAYSDAQQGAINLANNIIDEISQ